MGEYWLELNLHDKLPWFQMTKKCLVRNLLELGYTSIKIFKAKKNSGTDQKAGLGEILVPFYAFNRI